jgi:PAS domain S-box-containing protein
MLAKVSPPTRTFHLFSWPAVAAMLLLVQAALSISLKQAATLNGYCEICYLLLLLLASGVATLNAVQSKQAIRLFWSFLGVAFGLWALVPFIYFYNLALQGKNPAFLSVNPPLFLHVLMMIAAVASRPHLGLPSRRPYRTTLNFFLLLFFLVFAYAFLFPYLYVSNSTRTIVQFEVFYFLVNLSLVVILGMLASGSQPPWKSIYWNLFGASTLYTLGSMVNNLVSGIRDPSGDLAGMPVARGLIGIFFTAAISWFVWVALQGWKQALELAQTVELDTKDTRRTTLLAMLVVVAIPLAGIWELFRADEPYSTRTTRLLIVLITAVLLAVAAFIQAYLSNRELASDVGILNERLRSAMESGKAVGWEWNLKSGRDFWFGDLKTMFGIGADMHVGRPEDFHRYVHPEDRKLVSDAVADAKINHGPYATEFRVIWPDGTQRWVAAGGRFYYSRNNEPERMLGMAVDITGRKQLEAELHESQERMAGIVASAMDAIIAIDEAQRIVLFNAAAEKMFGCPAQDVIGSHIERFIPERFRALHSGHIRHFGETGTASRNMGTLGTLWASRSNGDEFPIEASISHVDAAGKKLFTVILRDVTDRRQAEEALRESEKRFRLVANTAPVMIWMSGTDKLCTYFNTPWLDFTGRSLESELGNGWAEGVHPEDFKTCLETYTKAFDRRERFSMEYRLRRNDGEYRWVSDMGVPRFNQDGSFAGYIGSCVDVTERTLAEEALRESEDKLRLLLFSTAEAIYGMDLEGRCTFCNPACLRALGYYRPEELLGKNMHHLIHHSHSDGTLFPEEECGILQALRTGEGIHLDDEVLWRANGTSFPAEYWSYPQRRGQEVVGAVIAFVDITERKETEAALASVSRRLIEAQERERTRIARELHDDIGQRLALLNIELEQLRKGSPDLSAAVHTRIGELQKQTAEIATDVQSMSHELHSSKLEYLGLVTAMGGFCKEFSEQQKVEIVFVHDEIPSTLPRETSLCLFRVLQEALHNAVKHSGARHCDVELRYASEAIDLTVRDSGSGFDAQQAMKTHGLGLTSMAERLKLVDGQLSIDSRSNRGTTIHARVPFRARSDSVRAAGFS